MPSWCHWSKPAYHSRLHDGKIWYSARYWGMDSYLKFSFSLQLSMKPSRLTVTKTSSPKELPSSKSLIFGQTFVSHLFVLFVCCASLWSQSDHMLRIPWNDATGWGAPSIVPCKIPGLHNSFYWYYPLRLFQLALSICPLVLPCFIMPNLYLRVWKPTGTRMAP